MLVPDKKGDQIQFQREIIETPVFVKGEETLGLKVV